MERFSKSSAKSVSLHTHRTFRPSFLPFGRLLVILGSLFAIPAHAFPAVKPPIYGSLDDSEDLDTADIVGRLAIIASLVLTGGVFAGLTLGLMGLDETTLRVLIQSGKDDEKICAGKVLSLLENGKHWVLVTLLLGNVIVNETLPIILDSVFGGGWQAVLISTGLIVIFGEIIPQAICVRHGLRIGAYLSPFVLCLMYALYPLAYPVAMLLDHFLGEHHGTVYRRTELKTLVSLHQTHSPADVDGLTEDEVTIIGAVLELRQKPVSLVMTPMEDVYTLSSDHILDRATTEQIRSAGYSRIPVHSPNNQWHFLGMLLVKQLIVYDPEEAQPVSSFTLAPLPTASSDTSCLDILNFFQEGKSHMALVKSSDSDDDSMALGVITLEDVIEELIGEEIIDETDVFVDVHNKIRVLRRPQNIRSVPAKLQHLFARRQTAPPGDFLQISGQSKGKKNDQKGANVKIGKYGAVMGEERRTNENEPLIK